MDYSTEFTTHINIMNLACKLHEDVIKFEKKFPDIVEDYKKDQSIKTHHGFYEIDKAYVDEKKKLSYLYHDIQDILYCYPHSPNFFEPSIGDCLCALISIRTFLLIVNRDSDLIYDVKTIWDETMQALDLEGRIEMKEHHTWTEHDDIKVLYIYKFGIDDLSLSKHQIAEMIGITDSSLNMRIGNFKDIDTGAGLSHSAEMTRRVFKYITNTRKLIYFI